MTGEIEHENARKFALAGNATFTLVSEDTQKRFTYRMSKCDKNAALYFIEVLVGSDNVSDYRYCGCYNNDTCKFTPTVSYRNSPTYAWPASLRAIQYFLCNIDNLSCKLHMYHEGKCARCGRKLTTPESITRGIGPECLRRM